MSTTTEDVIHIKKSNALKALKGASSEVKKTLNVLFEGQVYENIMEVVKSFEDALPLYIQRFGPLSQLESMLLNSTCESVRSERHHLRLRIIISVINEGWEANHSDNNQTKYEPRFYHKSGAGLSYYGYVNWYTHTVVGPRLCLESYQKAEYMGTQFIDEYKGLFNYKY